MPDKEVLNILKANIAYIRERFDVKSLSLFGSAARGDYRTDSDVDILVDMPPRILLMSSLKSFLEQILNKSVDLIRRHPHLSNKFLSQINKDEIRIL